jgi:phosphohistidine phosphatase
MRRVIIVRHAKSVPYGYDNDFQRDLTDRGISDAEKISTTLKEEGIIPDLIIASPARRTMHTANIYCRNLGIDPATIRQETSFYDSATTQDFIDVLQKLPDEVQTVCVFGHNPAVYYWVSNLVKYFNGDMPTCSTVAIDFAVDKWADVAARIGKKAFQYIPKEM